MNLTLHYSIPSPYAQKTILAFYEKGVEFTPAQVNLFDPAGHAAYKKLYPLAKIPLLTGDNDLFIPESTIIIEYLENEFPGTGAQLIPADKTAARRVRFKDRMFDLYVTDQVSAIFFDSLKPADKQNLEAVAKAHATLDVSFEFIEGMLKDNAYTAGSSISMADCALFPSVFYAQRLHPFKERKNMVAWIERMMQRASVKRLLVELLPALEKFNTK